MARMSDTQVQTGRGHETNEDRNVGPHCCSRTISRTRIAVGTISIVAVECGGSGMDE